MNNKTMFACILIAGSAFGGLWTFAADKAESKSSVSEDFESAVRAKDGTLMPEEWDVQHWSGKGHVGLISGEKNVSSGKYAMEVAVDPAPNKAIGVCNYKKDLDISGGKIYYVRLKVKGKGSFSAGLYVYGSKGKHLGTRLTEKNNTSIDSAVWENFDSKIDIPATMKGVEVEKAKLFLLVKPGSDLLFDDLSVSSSAN